VTGSEERAARTALAGLELTADQINAVTGEVRWHLGNGVQGALEPADLWATAVETVWRIKSKWPLSGGGLLRRNVRWRLRDLLRSEAHAHGVIRSHGRITNDAPATDDTAWGRCACGAVEWKQGTKLCPGCREERRLAVYRRYHAKRALLKQAVA
jgi:hypothetical protein